MDMLRSSFFQYRKILRGVQGFLVCAALFFLLGLWLKGQYPEVEKTLKKASPSLVSGEGVALPSLDWTFKKLEKRPDVPPEDGCIVLVDNKLNQYVVRNNEEIYLDYCPDKGAITPSEQKTPFSIVPRWDTNGSVWIDIRFQLPSMTKETSLALLETGRDVELKVTEGLKHYVKELQKAKAYPPDTMFQLYGGHKYRALSHLHRLEIEGKMWFVGLGDLLIYDSGHWRKSREGEKTSDYPLLHITKISQQKMELTLFDAEGKESVRIPLFITSVKRPAPHFAEIFAQPRQRTPRSISCRLGGKSRILQEGDWLVQTGKSWQVVQSAEELGKLLQYQSSCDLIILDKVEKQALTGYYFDAKRTSSQKITVPLLEEKSKKKNRSSATMEIHDQEM